MINANMRDYTYFTFGANNIYGEPQLSGPMGTVKMSIDVIAQSIVDNVNYSSTTYIGLTRDAKVDDTYVIEYEGKRLKVLYINPKGRLKQVYLNEY